MNIQYLNTDLDIKSKEDIAPIIKAFGNKVYVLHQESKESYYFASLEINDNVVDANLTAEYFCNLVARLPDDIRAIWDNCDDRILDIGYESGTLPRYYRSELKPTTVQKIAEVGMSIVITIYPLSEDASISV
ncbi:MAG: hypothetical protein AB4368_15500 [Xenococcaceae cyanobacterium]